MIDLARLNGFATGEFVATLAGIFEHSPWVAQRVCPARPFESRKRLLEAMQTAVEEATSAEQMALIRAHPKLRVSGRATQPLTAASLSEQRGAGLEACSPEEALQLDALNELYTKKFAMPFILAVRGHTPKSIIASCEQRLANDELGERARALKEIGLIAGYRLADLVSDTGC